MNQYKLDSHLDHEENDEEEDEGGVEVGDVEGGTKSSDESVSADHHGKKHCCQFWAEISHKAEKERINYTGASTCLSLRPGGGEFTFHIGKLNIKAVVKFF